MYVIQIFFHFVYQFLQLTSVCFKRRTPSVAQIFFSRNDGRDKQLFLCYHRKEMFKSIKFKIFLENALRFGRKTVQKRGWSPSVLKMSIFKRQITKSVIIDRKNSMSHSRYQQKRFTIHKEREEKNSFFILILHSDWETTNKIFSQMIFWDEENNFF